jgi:DNA-binding NtrC family response regulator
MLLAAHFLERAGRPGVTLSEEAERSLTRHSWPGNVRELRGVLEAAANLAEGGVITDDHLRLPATRGRAASRPPAGDGTTVETLAEVERRHIISVYESMGHNKTQAARALGIGLQTLHRKLKSYNAS